MGPSLTAPLREVVPSTNRLANEHAALMVELFADACKRFKADPRMRERRFGLRVLLSLLEQWIEPLGQSGAPPLTLAQREYQEAVIAAEEASAKWPDLDWSSDQLKPYTERLRLAKEALDNERGNR